MAYVRSTDLGAGTGEIGEDQPAALYDRLVVGDTGGMVLDGAVADGFEYRLNQCCSVRRIEVGCHFVPMSRQDVLDEPGNPGADLSGLFRAADARGQLVQCPVQFRSVRVSDERGLDHRIHGVRKRLVRLPRRVEGCDQFLTVVIDDSGRERALVGKVLVERTDAHACALGDARSGQSLKALFLQKLSGGDDDRLHRGTCACLPGKFARIYIDLRVHARCRSECEYKT